MNGRNLNPLDEMLRRDGKLNSHGQEPLNDPEPEDSYEAQLGDGRNARHGVWSVQIIENNGKLWMIPYGCIEQGSGQLNGNTFRFECVLGEVVHEVVIEGPQIQYAVDKFSAGKRESWHTRGAGTTTIRVRALRKAAKPKIGTAEEESGGPARGRDEEMPSR